MTPSLFGPQRWTLGAKLSATFSVVIALVVAAVSLAVLSRSRSALEHEVREHGADIAQNLARLSAQLVLEENLWGLYKVVRDVVVGGSQGDNLLEYAAVIDANGIILAHSDPERHPIGEPLSRDERINAESYRSGVTWWAGRPSGGRIHHFSAPVIIDGHQVATARVGISLRQLEATMARMTVETLVLGIILAILGACLGYVISRRMTRPLIDLGHAADRIAAGHLAQPRAVSTKEKDEIGTLADRFNLMAQRLRDSQRDAQEAQIRVIRSERLASVGECAGSLAHEIRNPLGAVVAAARMLSSRAPQAASYDPERLATVIADETQRLNRILTDFLLFACPRPPARQAHSMTSLVAELLESLSLDELAKDRKLEARMGPDPIPCEMDRDQIRQALWNLLRNALEATPLHGRVLVETTRRASLIAVEIVDEGPGLPPERRARLFEPFFTTKANGSGLGLAIAHRIVTAHGGSIEVSCRPGEGTRMCLSLPASSEAPRASQAQRPEAA